MLLPGRIGLLDDIRQVQRLRERSHLAPCHYRLRHASRETLLAIAVDHIRNFQLGGLCKPLRRADAFLRIHPHVQRAVLHETEPALCIIQLRRRDAEIQQYTTHPARQTALLHHFTQIREGALHDLETPVRTKALLRHTHGRRVLVECQQTALRAQLLKDPLRVTSTPEGAIDIDTLRSRQQRLDCRLKQNRFVLQCA